MDDDDDDMYAPPEPVSTAPVQEPPVHEKREDTGSDMDEDDGEEGEDSESDIEIVTDAKDAKPPPTSSAAKPTAALKITQPGREGSGTPQPKIEPGLIVPPPVRAEESTPQPTSHDGKPGSAFPAFASSTLDIDAKPIYEPVGKPVTDIDMDADLAEDAKPWRLPGTDPADFFNYGFDEFTWATYCLKQKNTREENQAEKTRMDQMQAFFGGGGPPMPGMPGMMNMNMPMNMNMNMPMQQQQQQMPPEMMAALSQMMASGIDPSTMDPNTFAKMMGGGGATPLQDGNVNANVPTGPAGGQAFAPPSGPKAQRGKGRW